MKPLYACCKLELQKDCRWSRERYIQKNEAGRMAKSLLSNQNMNEDMWKPLDDTNVLPFI